MLRTRNKCSTYLEVRLLLEEEQSVHLAALDTPAVATMATTRSMLNAHISWNLYLAYLAYLATTRSMLNAHISWHLLGIPREVEASWHEESDEPTARTNCWDSWSLLLGLLWFWNSNRLSWYGVSRFWTFSFKPWWCHVSPREFSWVTQSWWEKGKTIAM